MACCSIRWCGKNSKKSNFTRDGITFHRFPKEASLKEKWIDCTKRENWFPSNYSVVCSQHFTEDSFYIMKNRRRLFNTAIPTMHLPVVNNTAVTSECSSEDLNTIPSSSSQHEPTSIISKAAKRDAIGPETPSQFRSPTKKRFYRRFLELSKKVKHKNKIIKLLRDKVRYYKKRVASLKFIISEL